ncbi:glutathione S-transferase family protein [Lichenibacterium ramalinae]|uniref:Glutathione S-transferase family protein n=1 Tax=Lichenibacterium ramalinae TaxID=2316527 RepID=A0A4Q2REN1_9HYPH|nr:glutathione S-transferase family protein [Lichenibacterium ramalinae]RYB06390.1 glutathione S-transferase family protein [Lichenibacterium ramalinae]
MKLYWGKHTCAIGIHVLLEEVGQPFTLEEVDVLGQENRREPFRAINAKMKVPVLVRPDGSKLTEYGAIASWLALTYPDKGLIPAAVEDRVRAQEIMDYAVGTLHGQAFGRVFMPTKFEPKDLLHKAGLGQSSTKAEGLAMVKDGFAILDQQLEGRPYAGGQAFSIADSALFYCERWAPETGVALPPNVAAHCDRMKARPSVKRALEVYGETP